MEHIALITGASRGLGAALAEALAPTHHIIAVARTLGALEELDDRIKAKGGETTLAPMDITVDAAMQQLCRAIHDRWGKLDLWVHAAVQAGPLCTAPDMTEKDLDKATAVNVTGTARLIRYTAPLLGDQGRAVFFDDDQIGTALWGSYGATKRAQIAMAQAWAAESTNSGPSVKILNPRPMPTGTRARFYPTQDTETLAHPRDEAARLLGQIRD